MVRSSRSRTRSADGHRWGVVVPVLLTSALVLAMAACGGGKGDDEPGPSSSVLLTPATLPDDVEAGTGRLVLDGEATLLTVRSCVLDAVTDEETGTVTELAIDADDGIALAVSLTRTTTPGDVPTVGDVITVADQVGSTPEILEAERAETGGRFIDLLAEGALVPLLEIDGELVRGEGVFGPPGARAGAEGVVEGSLIVRCPPAG